MWYENGKDFEYLLNENENPFIWRVQGENLKYIFN